MFSDAAWRLFFWSVVSSVRAEEEQGFIDEFKLSKPMSAKLSWLLDNHEFCLSQGP
jgi:hypothetical protein